MDFLQNTIGEATENLQEHLLIYLISAYLFSTYHVADIAIVVEDTSVNNSTDKTPAPWNINVNSIESLFKTEEK